MDTANKLETAKPNGEKSGPGEVSLGSYLRLIGKKILEDGKVDFHETDILMSIVSPIASFDLQSKRFKQILEEVREDGVITPEESDRLREVISSMTEVALPWQLRKCPKCGSPIAVTTMEGLETPHCPWCGAEVGIKDESHLGFVDRLFHLTKNFTNVRTEIMAGITTFMAMAYILAVNPSILSAAGMPAGGVLIATALAAFIGTGLMAIFTNYPFVLAAGMGLNAYFAFTVCGDMGYSWQFALLAVFTEGLVFLLLSLTKVREGIFNAIPFPLKKAVSVGIGLFITLIALKNAGILAQNPATFITIVKFSQVPFATVGISAVLAIIGTIATAIMLAKGWKGSILIGVFATWILGMAAQAAGVYIPDPEHGFFSLYPNFGINSFAQSFKEFGNIFGALFHPASWTHTVDGQVVGSGWALAKSIDFFVVMFAFFFVDLFDTLGTLIGVSLKGGFLNKGGHLPRISGALYSDSIATSVGAILGTSTTTTYVESASGVAAGGRTGLTAWVAAVLFLVSIAFSPLFLSIPGFATAPALIIVGFFMVNSVMSIDFDNVGDAVPAFLTIFAMPFFYSISDGIMWGVISYTIVNLAIGRAKQIHWLMYLLTLVFIAKYAFM